MTRAQKLAFAVGTGFFVARAVWRQARQADLDGQIVLITGGSRGLGLALAREFARHGAKLALCARDADELARAESDLRASGADVFTFPCDVTNPEAVDALISAVTERFGRIDVLVNNAGMIGVGPAQLMTRGDFEDAMDADFWGVAHPTLAVLPQMRARQSGRIVIVSSIGGKVSVPHLLPYSTAKFAATGFGEGLRAELARDGVSVTTICPGLLRTGSYSHAQFKGNQDAEFAWFSVSDNLPGLSISAENAARQIVAATRSGEATRVLSLPASLLSLFHGVAPNLLIDVLALVNRFVLPPPGGSSETATGKEIHTRRPRPILDFLTILGKRAAKRLNE